MKFIDKSEKKKYITGLFILFISWAFAGTKEDMAHLFTMLLVIQIYFSPSIERK
jgi:hypothetical protein